MAIGRDQGAIQKEGETVTKQNKIAREGRGKEEGRRKEQGGARF